MFAFGLVDWDDPSRDLSQEGLHIAPFIMTYSLNYYDEITLATKKCSEEDLA